MFDLTIFPLSLTAGREQHELPGLLVTHAPRKAARMRAQDTLVLYMKLANTASGGGEASAAFTPLQQQEMLHRLAETYYTYAGSVTSGLRAVTARLNDFLLSRNLKSASEGQTMAVINLLVIHGSSLVIAHGGPTHTFLLGKSQVQHFDDSQTSAGRGLGLSRQTMPRFYTAELTPGDLLLISPDAPPAWSDTTLANSPQLNFDTLRRRLLGSAGVELQAAVIRLQPGKGLIHTWKPGASGRVDTSGREATSGRGETSGRGKTPGEERPVRRGLFGLKKEPQPAGTHVAAEKQSPALEPPAEVPADADVPAEPAEEKIVYPLPLEGLPEMEDGQVILPARETPPAVPPAQPEPGVYLGKHVPAAETAKATPRPKREQSFPRTMAVPVAASAGEAPAVEGPAVEGATPAEKPARPRVELGLGKKLAALSGSIRSGWQHGAPGRARMSGAMTGAARRVMPRRTDPQGRMVPFFNFTAGTMLGIALLIPVIVVAVATAVYFEAGRSEQFQALFLQAQQYAQQAAQAGDPVQQREGWTRTFDLVRKAEQYGRSGDSAALRKQAQAALDGLEGIVRLDYQPAVRAFTRGVSISRISATLNDVYLLDGSQGRILRLYRTATGYEVDPKFTCGPGQAGAVIIGPLIDLAAMPVNNEPRATVVGIDAGGNLVYCSPSMEGFENRMLALPDAGWGNIRALKLYNDRLYVLDPPGNAVYYYDGENGLFNDKPHLYFGESVPKMADVVDIAVDQEFLYLLHQDGQMTICEGGGYSLANTRCSDAPYGDERAGYEPSPLLFEGTQFSQIQATQPPDPSLFTLDRANKSIYHLSLRRLNFQRQYRPQLDTDFPLPNVPPTAFAIAPNRRALIAFGNEVYFAPIP